jgi:hypothetical protein
MAKVLTKYTAYSNAGRDTTFEQCYNCSQEATSLIRVKGVGMPLAVVSGYSTASYVMKTTVSSENLTLVDGILTVWAISPTLMSLRRLLRSSYTICQLKQHLELQ